MTDIKLPEPVAWIDSLGNPHHLSAVQGVRERQLYGPWKPLCTVESACETYTLTLFAEPVTVRADEVLEVDVETGAARAIEALRAEVTLLREVAIEAEVLLKALKGQT